MEELIADLYRKDTKQGYASLKILEKISQENESVYPYLDVFAEMMEDENSYVRTRGILLIAANAKWDRDNKIDEIMDDYLKHIMDAKPITSRQCIKALPQIVRYKPDLRESILEALEKAKPELRYTESMWPLVKKDIAKVLKIVEDLD